jgi:hypothetical protein
MGAENLDYGSHSAAQPKFLAAKGKFLCLLSAVFNELFYEKLN